MVASGSHSLSDLLSLPIIFSMSELYVIYPVFNVSCSVHISLLTHSGANDVDLIHPTNCSE